MNKLLTYGLAVLISTSTLIYAAPSDQQGSGQGPQAQRERPGQLEGNAGGAGRYQGQIPEGMRKMMEERRQKLQELGRELESLKDYKFPDADKNQAYQQKVEQILKSYGELAKPPVRPDGQGRDGNREGLQRPERAGEGSSTNRPPRQARPERQGNSETKGKSTRPPLE